MEKWFDQLYETFIVDGRYKWLLEGFGNTITITLGALVIGVIIGTLIAVIKYYADDIPFLKVLSKVCDVYVTVIRGIPVTVLRLIFYFLIMNTADSIVTAIVTFGINSGAYMAELIRSGINAVDKGQMEAGRSLGLSQLQTMSKIILPQAIKYILPAIGNEMIALLKETSVAGYVAVIDITKAGNQIKNTTYDQVNPILLVALVYLVMVILMTKLLNVLERRLRKSER